MLHSGRTVQKSQRKARSLCYDLFLGNPLTPSRRTSAGGISVPSTSPCSPFFFCSAPCSAAAIAAWTRAELTPLAAHGRRCCSSRTSSSRTSAFFTAAISSLDYLPLHLCSINIFLIALHAWRRPKLLDAFLYFVCLPAACAALLFPTWAPLPPLNFMVIHSFTVHFLLALYPLALTLRGDMDPAAARVPALLCPARGDGRADLVL